MDELVKEIIELTDVWFSIVTIDHHKDRDCHWYIETTFSYGEPPKYIVRHWGYVYKDIKITCTTYESALLLLKNEIGKAISEQYEWALSNKEDFPRESKLICQLLEDRFVE